MRLCCFLVCLLFSVAPAPLFGADKPNIIFILSDDMGYSDIGCYGGTFVPTPNIDRMAKEGTRFTRFYTASPICSPSRTGCLTGMYPARWQITSFLQAKAGNRNCEQVDFLDPKAPSIARTLKTAGYTTAHIGKWHMGGGRDVTNAPPFRDYGFDEHVSTYESPEPHPALTATNWIWSEHDEIKRWSRTAFFVDKTLDFLRRNKNRSCFVNLWPDEMHTPWIPDEAAYREGSKTWEEERHFKAVLADYDHQIGRLFAGLKELGIDQQTVVIFTSDNGALPTFDGRRSTGLRGNKATLYEGGIRVPFIVRWPGRTPTGRVDDTSVLNAVDLFPTFCALAKAALPKAEFDGKDFSRTFFGKSASRRQPMFWEFGRNFHKPRVGESSPNVAVRDGDWKLLINADGTRQELYNLATDAGEAANVAGKNPRITARLSKAALKWRNSLP